MENLTINDEPCNSSIGIQFYNLDNNFDRIPGRLSGSKKIYNKDDFTVEIISDSTHLNNKKANEAFPQNFHSFSKIRNKLEREEYI